MKKKLLIFSIISILFLSGCNLGENVKNTNLSGDKGNQKQEVVDNNEILNISFYERTKEFDKLKKELEDSVIFTSDSYDNGIQLVEKSIGDVVLERQNDNYVLNISVLNAISFEKAEIDAVVKNMEDNNLATAKLGDFTISKTASAEQKERLDFMKENDVVGIELDFWKAYADTNWLNEDGIPVYIRSDIYGAGDYLWALERIKDASSDRYYMFRIQIAGQDGLYSVLNPSDVSQIKINLLATDKMNIKEYDFCLEEYYDFGLKNEENTTIEEYFNENSEGKSSIVIDTLNIKMENDTIHLEFYNDSSQNVDDAMNKDNNIKENVETNEDKNINSEQEDSVLGLNSEIAKEYLKIVEQYKNYEYSISEIKYDLIYFNSDDVLDLVVDNEGFWVSVYLYDNGQIYNPVYKWAYGAMGNAGYDYIEKSGMILNYNSDYAGVIGTTSAFILNSNFDFDTLSATRLLDEFLDENHEMYSDILNAYNEYGGFYYNATKITEEEYNERMNAFLQNDKAETKVLMATKSIAEMLELLEINQENLDGLRVDLDPNDGTENIIVMDREQEVGVNGATFIIFADKDGERIKLGEFQAKGAEGPDYHIENGIIYTDYIAYLENPAPRTSYSLRNGVLEKKDCTFLNVNTKNIITFQEWFIIKSEDGDVNNADLDYVLKEGDKVIIRDINTTENRMEITFEKEDGTRVIAVY